MATMLEGWKRRARSLKKEVYALYLAYKDPRVPWYARLFAAVVVGYAFSPIDLIPDFVPILGYLDDVVLIPLGIALALRMIPPIVMQESRAHAEAVMRQGKPINQGAAAVIIAVWVVLAALSVVLVMRIVS